MTEKNKAIQLFSGGLDSILSASIIKNEGFDVISLHFYTGFTAPMDEEINSGGNYKWQLSEKMKEEAGKLGITLVPLDISGDEYKEILLHPKHGYGSCGNPCIDCHTYFLKKAREIMIKENAAFVFTGEVLGQRPMSQHRIALAQIEKESGLAGYLLRPLSAKLLPPTIPETSGVINREHLYDISGRSRKPQFELARKFGIDFYPNPGGGCFLTDVSFGKRFRRLLAESKGREIEMYELNALKTGRHIYLKSGIKIVVGRTEPENNYFTSLLEEHCWVFEARDYYGASVFAFGDPSQDDFVAIARITARYGKGIGSKDVAILARKGERTETFIVDSALPEEIEPYILN